MKSVYAGMILFLFTCLFLDAAEELSDVSEGVTTELMKELYLDKSYDTGLTLTGATGFFLTTGTESLFENGFFAGANLEVQTTEINDETIRTSTLSAVAAYGLVHELFGPFKNLEVSGRLPLVYQDRPDDTVVSLGDIQVSAKVGLLEEDPFRPAIPAISFSVSMYLPTAEEDVEYIDKFGFEFGALFGKTVSDSRSETDFKFYMELIASYISFNDETDFLVKGNFGMGFPLMGVKDTYLMIEYGLISKSDAHLENGDMFVISARYRNDRFNASGGIKIRDYDDQDIKHRGVFVAYEMKF